MSQYNDLNRWGVNTLKTLQWLCGQALKGARPTYAQFFNWYTHNLRGGKEALKKTWRDLYDARIVDTLNPNDSYEFNGRD